MSYYWLLILNCKKLCLRIVLSGFPGACLCKHKANFWILAKSRIISHCTRTSGLVPQSQAFYLSNLFNMLVTLPLVWCKLRSVSLWHNSFFPVPVPPNTEGEEISPLTVPLWCSSTDSALPSILCSHLPSGHWDWQQSVLAGQQSQHCSTMDT